jgi:hypothetical protein
MRPLTRFVSCRVLATLPLLIHLSACHTWRTVPGPVGQQVSDERIRQARLTLTNHAQLTLRDVTVRHDSVIGFFGDARERRAVPVADVTSIDRRQVSAGRTTAAVVGSAAAAFVVMLGLAIAAFSGDVHAVPAPSVP